MNLLELLPEEIFEHVVSFLNQSEFLLCSKISKKFEKTIFATKILTVDYATKLPIKKFTRAKFSLKFQGAPGGPGQKILSSFPGRVFSAKYCYYIATIYLGKMINLEKLYITNVNEDILGLSKLASLKYFYNRGEVFDISKLVTLTNLEELNLGEISSTEKLLLLPKLKKLKICTSRDCEGYNEIFASLNITNFGVNFIWNTAEKNLLEYRQATKLSIESPCQSFTGAALLKFARLKSLRLRTCRNFHARHLRNLDLKVLELANVAVVDGNIEHMTSLEFLSINGCGITKSPSTKLTTLVLERNRNAYWHELTPAPKITGQTKAAPKFLSSSLRTMTSLTNLTIGVSHIKGKDLKNLTNLRKLTLNGANKIKNSDISHLTNLVYLQNNYSSITGEIFRLLPNLVQK